MKKIVGILLLSASFIFAAMNLQTASKNELMSIKGIGPKKADSIIKYRKTHKLRSAEDLKKIKGFGDGIVSNVKNNVKVSKSKKNLKKKVSKIDDKRKSKIKKAKKTTASKKDLKAKKQKINAKAKKKKSKVKKDYKEKKAKKIKKIKKEKK